MSGPAATPVFRKTVTVRADAIDGNGHVNNVAYVQWMQDIAIEHFTSLGGVEAMGDEVTWVAAEHKVQYLAPALEGDVIEVRTWVAEMRRVRSLRRYEFIRRSDNKVLVRGETQWAVVDTKTGAPRSVPPAVARIFAAVRAQPPHAPEEENNRPPRAG